MTSENSVMFKGTKDGLLILLDPEVDFFVIKSQLESKILEAKKFFKGAQISIGFKGRNLSEQEQNELVKIIGEKSGLNITYIFDENNKSITEHLQNDGDLGKEQALDIGGFTEGPTKFYRGTVRSGQCLRYEGNIVVMGDVNPGGMVVAQGNIIVLGILKGIAHAGANGNCSSFIVALQLYPMQLRIAELYTRNPEGDEHAEQTLKISQSTEIAYVIDNKMIIEPLDKKSIYNLPMAY